MTQTRRSLASRSILPAFLLASTALLNGAEVGGTLEFTNGSDVEIEIKQWASRARRPSVGRGPKGSPRGAEAPSKSQFDLGTGDGSRILAPGESVPIKTDLPITAFKIVAREQGRKPREVSATLSFPDNRAASLSLLDPNHLAVSQPTVDNRYRFTWTENTSGLEFVPVEPEKQMEPLVLEGPGPAGGTEAGNAPAQENHQGPRDEEEFVFVPKAATLPRPMTAVPSGAAQDRENGEDALEFVSNEACASGAGSTPVDFSGQSEDPDAMVLVPVSGQERVGLVSTTEVADLTSRPVAPLEPDAPWEDDGLDPIHLRRTAALRRELQTLRKTGALRRITAAERAWAEAFHRSAVKKQDAVNRPHVDLKSMKWMADVVDRGKLQASLVQGKAKVAGENAYWASVRKRQARRQAGRHAQRQDYAERGLGWLDTIKGSLPREGVMGKDGHFEAQVYQATIAPNTDAPESQDQSLQAAPDASAAEAHLPVPETVVLRPERVDGAPLPMVEFIAKVRPDGEVVLLPEFNFAVQQVVSTGTTRTSAPLVRAHSDPTGQPDGMVSLLAIDQPVTVSEDEQTQALGTLGAQSLPAALGASPDLAAMFGAMF